MLAIGLIILGILTRLIPHAPNFSPLAAIALFAGVYLKGKKSFIVPLAIYLASDFIIGFHKTVFFCWGAIAIIALLGKSLKQHKTILNTFVYSVASATIFFLITNFGVWLSGYYPQTIAGLKECFIMALPFFRISLVSGLLYSLVLFGTYEIVNKLVKEKNIRSVLFS